MTLSGGVLDFGFPNRFKPSGKTDNVVIVNEDLGFTASLITATNDVLETSMPFPQEWDQDTEVVMVESIQFGHEGGAGHQDDLMSAFGVNMSYLDRSPAATFRGGITDAEDEYRKSVFTGGRTWAGDDYFFPSTVAEAGSSGFFPAQPNITGRWTPPFKLMMGHQPIYWDLYNMNFVTAVATGNETAANYTTFEGTVGEYWYTMARMPKPLRDLMATLNGLPFRLAILGS